MSEHFLETFVGVHTADAEEVEISYSDGTLVLRYVDWKEEAQSANFPDTLAFRWQETDDVTTPRDDTTYKVANSSWLASQISGIPAQNEYVHTNCLSTPAVYSTSFAKKYKKHEFSLRSAS